MATGVPDLAMMVPSPRAAASTNSENFAFASARVSCFILCAVMTFASIAFSTYIGDLTKVGQYGRAIFCKYWLKIGDRQPRHDAGGGGRRNAPSPRATTSLYAGRFSISIGVSGCSSL